MKVLMINASPRFNGNTQMALEQIAATLATEGIDSEIVPLGTRPVRSCIACNKCQEQGLGRCIFDDDVCNKISARMDGCPGCRLPGLLRPAQRRLVVAHAAHALFGWRQVCRQACRSCGHLPPGRRFGSLSDDAHAL